MFRAIRPQSSHRRGVILLVVLTMLTLFSIVGLAFVLYADAEALSSRTFRETEDPPRPDAEPELLLAYFLGQLLFDCPDNPQGISSALRGHSLYRTLYGLNGTGNNVPFNGTGRLHYVYPSTPTAQFPTVPPPVLQNQNDYELINYTYFPADGFVRDPERFGFRASPTAALTPFIGGFNPPYTYPDLNNMFLAAVRASDGRVLMPSFHRPWLFGSLAAIPGTPNPNPNWTNPEGKYKILRPRPQEHPDFPYPEDEGGDVKNLLDCPGYYDPVTSRVYNNDSIWIDLGYPVKVAANGKKFKPLFAPLIVDLDNRVNVNVHGNIRGLNRTHVSNQGLGRWEINLGRVLDRPAGSTPEWPNLFAGNPNYMNQPAGRYGPNLLPRTPGTVSALPYSSTQLYTRPHFYGRLDYDGCNEQTWGPSGRVLLPGTGAGAPVSHSAFPFFNPTGGYAGYGDAAPGVPAASAVERRDHPLSYNYFDQFPTSVDDRFFRLSNMEALLRYNETGTHAMTSELFRLCPENFTDPKIRRLVTTRSMDLGKPGASPWVWHVNPPASAMTPFAALYKPYLLTGTNLYPRGEAIPFPTPGMPRPGVPAGSNFAAEWRALMPALGQLDLNRGLPEFPAPTTSGPYPATSLPVFRAAQEARKQLARDIFEQLRYAVGARNPTAVAATLPAPPNPPNTPNPEFDALRWLAQLAVNLVDFIDPDDYMTPFNWVSPTNTTHWVFGTELPRVVVNEAYAEYTPPNMSMNHVVNVWVELHNPLHADPTLSDNGTARLDFGSPANYGVYQVVLCKPDTTGHLQHRFNVWGTPSPIPQSSANLVHQQAISSSPAIVDRFTGPGGAVRDRILPVGEGYASPSRGPNRNQGFYLLGPVGLFPGANPAQPDPEPNLTSNGMSFRVPPAELQPPTVLLRRLACPRMPPQPNPTQPDYNPYITVDYMENVRLNPVADPITERYSVGRSQPYAGHPSQLKPQAPDPPPAIQPRHTFFRHNAREAMGPPDAAAAGQTLKLPFDWLVHLDRQLVSPMELLHVSGFRPYQLTQQFMTGDTADRQFKHLAPWFDEESRIYRVFEFLQTHERGASMVAANSNVRVRLIYPPLPGTNLHRIVPEVRNPSASPQWRDSLQGVGDNGVGWRITVGSRIIIGTGANQENVLVVARPSGWPNDPNAFWANLIKPHSPGEPITVFNQRDRIPGKINLNTIWDLETLRAICDPQTSNGFTDADVNAIFNQLLARRSRGPQHTPSRNDRPFRGMATAVTPPGGAVYNIHGSGINDTLLRSTSDGSVDTPRLFQHPALSVTHPYVKNEILSKIFNHVTTRSNVFAVWLTVGFFEVQDRDASGNPLVPPQLGREIGRDENRHVRHRMFAIVDRTYHPDATYGSGSGGTTAEYVRLTNPLGPPEPSITTYDAGRVRVYPASMEGIQLGAAVTVVGKFQPTDPMTGEPQVDPITGEPVYRTRSYAVTVVAIDPDNNPPQWFEAQNFTILHDAGFRISYVFHTVSIPVGNFPGMAQNFDPRSRASPFFASEAVPYFSIINK
jgi:hypothetical protein